MIKLSFRFVNIFIKDLKKKVRIILQIETNKSLNGNNALTNSQSDEKLISNTLNITVVNKSENQEDKQLPSLFSVPNLMQQNSSQQQSDESNGLNKRKPSDIIENSLNKYLKLKSTTFNLDKITEVNSIIVIGKVKISENDINSCFYLTS